LIFGVSITRFDATKISHSELFADQPRFFR
jgi:hypothetical protein